RQHPAQGFDVAADEADALRQHQPPLDAALARRRAVVVDDAVDPFAAEGRILGARHQAGVLERNAALVVEAVEDPGLHLSLVQLAFVQQAVERMLAVIAIVADLAESALEFHRLQEFRHRRISMPSYPASQPAFSMAARSGESASRMG